MDNFTIDVTGAGEESLTKALEIAFALNCPGGKATHYKVANLELVTNYYSNKSSEHLPENLSQAPGLHVHHRSEYRQHAEGHMTLMLLWSDDGPGVTYPLPYPMRIKDAVPFVRGWLTNAGDPGNPPDIDGDLRSGWRVFTEYWGHLAGCSYAIVGVQAVYAMHGK